MLDQSSGRNTFLIVFITTLVVGGLMIFLVFNVVYPPSSPEQPALSVSTATPSYSPIPTTAFVTASPPPIQTPVPTPSPTQDASQYVVQPGDTLSAIAQRFSTTVDELKQLNNLQGNTIYPDQILVIGPPSPGDVLPTETPVFTVTPSPVVFSGEHIVSPGETLADIAILYGVSIEDVRFANAMIGETILPGQRLIIPIAESPALPPWSFSIVEGNLAAAYPQVLQKDRFTLHYTPGTYPAQDPEIIADLVQGALENIESVLSAQLQDHFDVYIAGSVFAAPNRTLRGRTFSFRWQTFFLHDGTGNPADQQYIATHELTHLFAWNVFGQPVSVMLSEGVAVYTGMKAIERSQHIPVDTFCLAYLDAGKLPYISTSLSYQGHNLDLENYYSAGCFVGYLIETYGPSSFAQLYPTEDYYGIYGKSLSELELDWRAQLASKNDLEGIDPTELSALVNEITGTYATFFSSFSGTAKQIDAYRELDHARIALLEGRFADANQFLSLFREYLAGG